MIVAGIEDETVTLLPADGAAEVEVDPLAGVPDTPVADGVPEEVLLFETPEVPEPDAAGAEPELDAELLDTFGGWLLREAGGAVPDAAGVDPEPDTELPEALGD